MAQISCSEGVNEAVPPNCAPGAIKLFIDNIPRSYNEDQLLPLFESFGPVIDLAIIRDRTTGLSTGRADLWFGDRAHAEEAMRQLNRKGVLPRRHLKPLEIHEALSDHHTQQDAVQHTTLRALRKPCQRGPDNGDVVMQSHEVDQSAPLFQNAVVHLHNMQTLSGASVVMSPSANSTSIVFNITGTHGQVQAAKLMLVALLNVKVCPIAEDDNEG